MYFVCGNLYSVVIIKSAFERRKIIEFYGEDIWFFAKGIFTIFNCSGSNSLTIVVTNLSDFWVCNSLLPSWVMIDLTLRPSGVSSSNSSLSLNEIDVFLNVELDDSTNLSSLLVSSTTGDTALPNLRTIIPTPTKNKKIKVNPCVTYKL